jgi:hypothetical protein
MFGSAKGYAVAASGDLVKLSCLVGMIAGLCKAMGIIIYLVPVAKWKGQLTKEAVIYRIEKILGKCTYEKDEWDAVGIGLWAKGLL